MKKISLSDKKKKIAMTIFGVIGVIATLLMFLPGVMYVDDGQNVYIASYLLIFGGTVESVTVMEPFNFNVVLLFFWVLPLVGGICAFLLSDKWRNDLIVALIYLVSGILIIFTRQIALSMQGLAGTNIAMSFGPIIASVLLLLSAVLLVLKAIFVNHPEN